MRYGIFSVKRHGYHVFIMNFNRDRLSRLRNPLLCVIEHALGSFLLCLIITKYMFSVGFVSFIKRFVWIIIFMYLSYKRSKKDFSGFWSRKFSKFTPLLKFHSHQNFTVFIEYWNLSYYVHVRVHVVYMLINPTYTILNCTLRNLY